MPALALTLYGAVERRQLEAADTQREALRLARLAAANQERVVDGAHHLLEALARLPAARGDLAACASTFADLLVDNPVYLNITATDATGTRRRADPAAGHLARHGGDGTVGVARDAEWGPTERALFTATVDVPIVRDDLLAALERARRTAAG